MGCPEVSKLSPRKQHGVDVREYNTMKDASLEHLTLARSQAALQSPFQVRIGADAPVELLLHRLITHQRRVGSQLIVKVDSAPSLERPCEWDWSWNGQA